MKIWSRTWRSPILSALALTFLAYTAGAYFGVPALVRHMAEDQAAAALHRPVTLGEIIFNPYTLRLSLVDVTVAGRENPQPVLQASRVNLQLSWRSLPKLALVLKQRPLFASSASRQRPSTFPTCWEACPTGHLCHLQYPI